MKFLQIAITDTDKILRTTSSDATLVGASFVVIIALSSVAVFLYLRNEKIRNEYIEHLKASNETMIQVHSTINLAINQVAKIIDFVESKK